MDCILGIDPGKHGAMVVLNEEGKALDVMRMPLVGEGKKSWINLGAVVEFFQKHSPGCVVYEYTRPAGTMHGKSTWWAMGEMRGQIEGICAGMKLSVQAVPPKTWQAMLPGKPAKLDRSELKTFVMNFAAKRWPELNITKKKDSDIADAACIAEWGRRWFLGSEETPRTTAADTTLRSKAT